MAGSSETWRAVIPSYPRYRVVAPDLLGHGESDKPRGDYSLGAFAVWLRDLLDELGISRATVIGHHSAAAWPCSSSTSTLTTANGWYSSATVVSAPMSAGHSTAVSPGAELIMPIIAPRPVLTAGNKLSSWFSATGIQSPRGGEMWRAYSSLADGETRQAFLRTLRSVVDHRGQAVSALNRLHMAAELPTMVIWGDHDGIIPSIMAMRCRSATREPTRGARRRRPLSPR